MNNIYKKLLFYLICISFFGVEFLTAQNVMQNPGFESGLIAPWVHGNEGNGVIINDAYEGDFAAKGHLEYYISGLDGGETYTWTTQAKCHDLCNSANMWIGIRDLLADTLIGNFNFTGHEDYAEAMMQFTAGGGEHRFFQWGQNGGEYSTDNHLLVKGGTTSTSELEAEADKILILTSGNGVLLSIEPSIREAEVFIHDFSGNLVYKGIVGSGMSVIDNSNFSATGIYAVSVRTDKTMKVKKAFIMM